MKANEISVILLAGGKSERFWPLPNKLTVSFLGQSFLTHQLALLKKIGFKKIVLVIPPNFSTNAFDRTGITVVEQKGEGQAGGVRSGILETGNTPVLILNADDVIESELVEKIIDAATPAKQLLVGYKVEKYFPGGYFVLHGKKIARIHEKPGEGKEPSSFVRLVCDFFPNPTLLLEALKKVKSNEDNVYEEAISALISTGEEFEMVEYTGTWVPVKYPWQLLNAHEYFLGTIKKSKIAPSAKIHKTASISGEVIIGENVRILEYAKIVGPVYIGPNSIIGNNTLIRASNIGEGCVVGFSSDVTRSYLGDGVWLHANYVGDSVLSSGVTMGSGATLANVRLDDGFINSSVKGKRISTHRNKLGALIGEAVHIGVGVYVMPGVKIGAHSSIGAGVLLQEDLPARKRCFIKQTHTIVEQSDTLAPDRSDFKQKI